MYRPLHDTFDTCLTLLTLECQKCHEACEVVVWLYYGPPLSRSQGVDFALRYRAMVGNIVESDKIKRAVAEAGAHTQESSPHDFLEPRSMAVLVHVRP